MKHRLVEKEELVKETAEVKKERIGVVNCEYLSVRQEPKSNAKLIKIIKKGDKVAVDSTFDDKLWYKIEDGYTRKAFIDIL